MNASKTFNSYSKYYDLIYQKKKYKKEVNYINNLLKKFNYNKKNLLEFGSGTGGHANFFIKKGFKVHGIEKSKEMIKFCKKQKGFTFQQGDACKINLKKKYDIVISLFHVISYQIDKKNLNNFFKNASLHLNSNGILCFDFWYTPAVNYQKPKIMIKEIKYKNYKMIRLAEPKIYKKENIINVKYTIMMNNYLKKKIDVVRENHLMKHFSFKELKKVFEKHSFKCIHLSELVSGNKPSKNTWGVFCMLKKIANHDTRK